jgi:hypothetical protein
MMAITAIAFFTAIKNNKKAITAFIAAIKPQ